ncbi:unnamed protein product, partial [Heterosigma akashiwo]
TWHSSKVLFEGGAKVAEAMFSSFLQAIWGALLFLWDWVMGLVSSLGGSKTISLPKGMRVKIEKMIGEGGYSYVYVARDTKTRGKYALKKVLCQVPEQVAMVRREAAVHDAFAH